jgi:hypothetical protein
LKLRDFVACDLFNLGKCTLELISFCVFCEQFTPPFEVLY